MNAADLFSHLRRRGVTLEARGDRLRFKPASAMPSGLLADLRAHKHELLAMLPRVPGEVDPQISEAGPPGAVLIDLPGFGEVWVALSLDVAEVLRDGEQHLEAPKPVLLPADLDQLRGLPPAAIRRVLDMIAVIPGARLAADGRVVMRKVIIHAASQGEPDA